MLTLAGCGRETSFAAFFAGASCVCDKLLSCLTLALLDVPYLSLFLCLNALCSSALILGASSTTRKGIERRTAVGVWFFTKHPNSVWRLCLRSDKMKSFFVRMLSARSPASFGSIPATILVVVLVSRVCFNSFNCESD